MLSKSTTATVSAEEDTRAAAEALAAAQRPNSPPPPEPDQSLADRTTLTTEAPSLASHDRPSAPASSKTAPPPKKKGAKPKLTAKEKRERGLLIEKITSALPLEFRGNDPNLRRHIESVIETFLDNSGRGIGSQYPHSLLHPGIQLRTSLCITVLEFIKPPDLNQARANKCLIALVNRKIVQKDNSTVGYLGLKFEVAILKTSLGLCSVPLARLADLIGQ